MLRDKITRANQLMYNLHMHAQVRTALA